MIISEGALVKEYSCKGKKKAPLERGAFELNGGGNGIRTHERGFPP